MGKGRLYTPIQDDIGSILKCEVVSIDAAVPFSEHGKTFSMSTQRVRPTPSPPKRALAPVNPAPWNVQSTGRFTALTYNLLADLYATVSRTCLGCECNMQHAGCVLCASGTCTPCECISGKRTLHSRCILCAPTQGRLGVQAEQFSYCQPWMLAWGYRKQNLVAELVSYNADIMCLQVGNAVNQIMHAHLTS